VREACERMRARAEGRVADRLSSADTPLLVMRRRPKEAEV
jgi:hypothetical protein